MTEGGTLTFRECIGKYVCVYTHVVRGLCLCEEGLGQAASLDLPFSPVTCLERS